MQVLKWSLIALAILYVLIEMFFLIKTKKPLKTFLIYAFIGLCSITVINIISKYTGVYINLNCWTVGAGTVFSIPGVFALIVVKMFF
ncbi:MAG: pro-sigmaK processing inhibitor BofA family protein [bacterium]|nr:pro-sigmaK processing inhibitor BofA family protein [bacterium]